MSQETLKNQTNEDLSQYLWRAALLLAALVAAIVLIFSGMRYLQTFDPYIHEVLSIDGDPDRGQAIFQMNCAVCHGIEASGEVGPTLHSVSDHKSKVGLIKQVVSGKTPPMPQFQANPQDMADLLEYLETL